MSEAGSQGGFTPPATQASKPPQVLTALAASVGALSMGMIIGYASSSSNQLQANDPNNACTLIHDKPLTDVEDMFFSSAINIGAAVAAPFVGILMSKLGRRFSMILSVGPALLGWILIAAAVNLPMLVAGRVFAGACAGLASQSIPPYVSEIASAELRGTLGTVFQLMVTIGILLSYAIGAVLCWQWLAVVSLAPSILFGVSMFFSKESPTFLIAKGRTEEAKNVLQYFRGKNYNVEPELQEIKDQVSSSCDNTASLKDFLCRHNLQPLAISFFLMFFQQFSGINAILFNLNEVFEAVGAEGLSSAASAIIIAAAQVVITGLASVLMDKAGRRLLLLISSSLMTVSLVTMGIYFYAKENAWDSTSSIGWLPLVSLVVYIAAFSIGYGPIPWLMMGEIFGADVRAMGCTIATVTNWSISFVVTLIFKPLKNGIKDSGSFWFFAGFCVVNFVFCFFFVKETKGKTSQEIAAMFGAPVAKRQESIAYAQTVDISDEQAVEAEKSAGISDEQQAVEMENTIGTSDEQAIEMEDTIGMSD